MLYQSLKSIHYRTLLIFQNKKNPTDLRVKTWGGGDTSTPSPQDLRPWPYFAVNPPSTTEQLNTDY